MIASLLLALALMQLAPLAPPPVSQPPSASPAIAAVTLPTAAFTRGPVRADALNLARAILPEDLFLAALERTMVESFDKLEAKFADVDPKIAEALRTELPKAFRDHERANLPNTYDRYARALASHFTLAETTELTAFYQSRTGQKIIVGKFAGMDVSKLLDRFVKDPDADVTAGDIYQINRSAAGKIVEHLDEPDAAALRAFMKTPAFARLHAFTPTMMALEAQIATEPDPDLDEKMERIVSEILARHGVGGETT